MHHSYVIYGNAFLRFKVDLGLILGGSMSRQAPTEIHPKSNQDPPRAWWISDGCPVDLG